MRKPTSSSLPRVVEAMAEVIPALREFCTRDWEQEKKTEKCLSLNVNYSVDFLFIYFFTTSTYHCLMRPGSDETEEERKERQMCKRCRCKHISYYKASCTSLYYALCVYV